LVTVTVYGPGAAAVAVMVLDVAPFDQRYVALFASVTALSQAVVPVQYVPLPPEIDAVGCVE
jgi:hypothetical protein